MDIIEYQKTVIAEITKLVGVTPVRYDGSNGIEHAVWPLAPMPAMTERGRRAYVSAIHVSLEENVVVTIEMGQYAAAHGFYDDGTTAQLSNVPASVAIITAKALLGDLI